MVIWTLAKKDLWLLLRDPRALVILLAMPFIFILVLGLLLGEGFGQKPDHRLRVALVDLDEGYLGPVAVRESLAWLTATPGVGLPVVGPLAFRQALPGFKPWSKVVQQDLAQTAEIRVEIIPTLEEAKHLVEHSRRAAVLVFHRDFSARVSQTSFLAEGINPFHRDGVRLEAVGAELLQDKKQLTTAGIIDQVAQVTLLRVILPWMIGRAFEKLGDPSFMTMLADEVPIVRVLLPEPVRLSLGGAIQGALKRLFPKYELTGKTWAALTRSEPRTSRGAEARFYVDEGGTGLLRRGAANYQRLVPALAVMFAFFLVLTVSWLFVAERRQGTLKRLLAAPVSRTQLLLGKWLPCFAVSVGQGVLLWGAGKLIFGMSWGPQPLWLLPVIVATSLAAMGLALFVAALARTEIQVAIYGTLLVVVLALIGGCMMGDRELMPEQVQWLSLFTPHAWSLDAYKELLSVNPNLDIVSQACGVLTAFGAGFVLLAWWCLKLD
jgi:ABC-type Na+ efflux pump permease subunit